MALMRISLDCETLPTTELDIAPPLVCLSWADETGRKGLLHHADAKQRFAEILSHDLTITCNGAFDLAVCLRQWPDLTPLVWQAYDEDRVIDIQVAEKLDDIANIGDLYTRGTYSLADLAQQYLNQTLDKETYRLNYGPLRDVALNLWPEGAKQYAIDDAVATLEIHKKQPTSPDLFRQTRHAWWVHLMSVWGIHTDLARVARYNTRLLAEQEVAAKKLQERDLIRWEKAKGWVRNEKKARAYMESVFPNGPRTKPSKTFSKGQYSIDEIACLDSGDPYMEVYGDYASIKKQLSTDIPSLSKGELHSRFGSLRTNGRLDCSGYNLTNLPREGEGRPCFIPRPGKVFMDLDYTGLEAYTGAQACITLVGDSDMADVLLAGEDVHIHMTAALMNTSYEEAMAAYKAGDKNTIIQRQFSKIANYGLSGGMGDETFFRHAQRELKKVRAFDLARGITFADTARIRRTWLERWREWPYYFERHGDLVRFGDYQVEQLVSGRKRLVVGKGRYAELNNTMFSGLGADAFKNAGWLLSRECYDPSRNSILFGSRPVNAPHDQFLVETNDDEGAHDRAYRVKALMEGVSETWCPDVPLKTDPCLTDRWYKNSKALHNDKGRLMVYKEAA